MLNAQEGGRHVATRHHVIWAKALHRHDQLAKYHPVPWLRGHNVSWHQVFRLPESVHDKVHDKDWLIHRMAIRIVYFQALVIL